MFSPCGRHNRGYILIDRACQITGYLRGGIIGRSVYDDSDAD